MERDRARPRLPAHAREVRELLAHELLDLVEDDDTEPIPVHHHLRVHPLEHRALVLQEKLEPDELRDRPELPLGGVHENELPLIDRLDEVEALLGAEVLLDLVRHEGVQVRN